MKTNKSKSVFVSHEKDKPVLHFIWCWKLATTACVFRRFWPEFKWTYSTTHYRLWLLKKRGLITAVNNDSNQGRVWCLTQAGFNAIRPRLPLLVEEGFASENIGHDLWVQAAHLGEWLPRFSAADVGLVTEQQMRRIHPEQLPGWMPNSKLHRPDGYWLLPDGSGGHRLVGLEVELSQKANAKYEVTGNFYNRWESISRVVWVVSGESLFRKILAQFNTGYSRFRDIHNLIVLDDFTQRGWDSEILLGPERGQKLNEFLNQNRPNIRGTFAQQPPNRCSIPAILDCAIKRLNPEAYPHLKISEVA